jgi:glutamate decarboxylase
MKNAMQLLDTPANANAPDPVQRIPDIEERILRLFTGPADTAQPGTETISNMADAFASQTRVSSDVSYDALAKSFMESRIPSEPEDIQDYLRDLDSRVVAHSTNTGSPRFVGHMTSKLPLFVSELAKLVVAMNQNVVKAETAKAATPYERQAIAMIHRLIFEYSDEFYREHIQNTTSTLGAVASGGTLANLFALWCARNHVLGAGNSSKGAETEGIAAALRDHGYSGAVIIGSALMHYSLEKAAGLMGLGTSNLVKVPVDALGRVDLERMRIAVEEARANQQAIIALIGVAGTTDTGAMDPLRRIAQLAQEYGIHFHVDAAWGGPVLFSRKHRRKLEGIEQADSVTIDGHKQLYLPMGIGLTIFRNPAKPRAVEKQARYIIRPKSVDLGRRAIEGSRPSTALYLHAGLNILGARGYEYLIDHGIINAANFAGKVNAMAEFELLAEPEINIVVYRHIPEPLRDKAAAKMLSPAENLLINAWNTTLQKIQRQRGNSFVSRTALSSTGYGPDPAITALRAIFANPTTTMADIEWVLNEQLLIARSMPTERFSLNQAVQTA